MFFGGGALSFLWLLLPDLVWADEDVEIEVEATAETPPPPPSPSPEELLRAQLAAVEARLAALEAKTVPVEEVPTDVPPPLPEKIDPLVATGLQFSGYLQAQYQHNQLSQDELTPDGHPYNQDRFVLRRARLIVERPFDYGRVKLELDANTVDGLQVAPRRVYGTVHLPNPAAKEPYVALTAGLFDIPLGFELQQSTEERLFMERSLGSRALFPGETDIGAQLHGGLGPLRYQLAVVNGVPLSTTATATDVFTKKKTFLGRLGAEVESPDRYTFAGGASFLSGTGFHDGTTASAPQLLWSDANLNGLVSLDELGAIPAQAASPSSTYTQWAVNLDFRGAVHSPIGWTQLMGEATLASNLDRGLFAADPVSTGFDLRELAWNVAAIQDIFEYGAVGFRVDAYNGNSDAFEARRGQFLPVDLSVLTLSPLAMVQLPGFGRLLFQYDYVVDHLGRDVAGEPIDLANDQWILRAQVGF